jgi:hypothetical protein
MSYTYSKIATYTVGSGGVASIDFLNIPQTYTDLKAVLSGRGSSTSGTLRVRFNNSTTDYNWRTIYGTGSGSGSQSASSTTYIDSGSNAGNLNWSGTTASTFNNFEIYIPNYTGSTAKSLSIDSVVENNATLGYQLLEAGLWNNTSPITSISFFPAGSGETFVQYSTAHLYGIKAEL